MSTDPHADRMSEQAFSSTKRSWKFAGKQCDKHSRLSSSSESPEIQILLKKTLETGLHATTVNISQFPFAWISDFRVQETWMTQTSCKKQFYAFIQFCLFWGFFTPWLSIRSWLKLHFWLNCFFKNWDVNVLSGAQLINVCHTQESKWVNKSPGKTACK